MVENSLLLLVESFSSNRNAKRRLLEQTDFMTQKAEAFLKQEYVHSQIQQWDKPVKVWCFSSNCLQSRD
jgi:hypothetical protein